MQTKNQTAVNRTLLNPTTDVAHYLTDWALDGYLIRIKTIIV